MQSRTKPRRAQRFTKKEYTLWWPFVYLVTWREKRKCSLAQSHEGHKDSQRKNTPFGGPSCTWLLGVKKENAVSHKATKGTKIHKERIQPFVPLRVLG